MNRVQKAEQLEDRAGLSRFLAAIVLVVYFGIGWITGWSKPAPHEYLGALIIAATLLILAELRFIRAEIVRQGG